jgi:hypothetical protein
MVKNWDIAVVVLGMMIGFAIVLMNFTGMWPCNIIQTLNKSPLADYVNSNALVSNLADYVNSNALVSNLADYVNSNALVKNTIDDIHYWSTYSFRCN